MGAIIEKIILPSFSWTVRLFLIDNYNPPNYASSIIPFRNSLEGDSYAG